MALPLATTADDVRQFARYLARKPSGASPAEGKAVLGAALLDPRKVSTYQMLGLVTREDGRLKLTPDVGRAIARAQDEDFASLIRDRIAAIPAYSACLEWAFEQNLEQLDNSEVGAFWHDHFREPLGTDNEREIAQRATCFLQLAAGAHLGTFVTGRRGQPTRLEIDRDALEAFVHSGQFSPQPRQTSPEDLPADESGLDDQTLQDDAGSCAAPAAPVRADVEKRPDTALGQAIFIGHGKNKKPLEQLRKILDQFKVPHKVAVEEPNLGRPIGEKVRETMQGCNCAILIFTADEELKDLEGNPVWRPSENVVHEFGAASYLYGSRVVVLKEDCIRLPSNFSDIGYIAFSKDQLDAKAMDVLKELIGFGIIKITT